MSLNSHSIIPGMFVLPVPLTSSSGIFGLIVGFGLVDVLLLTLTTTELLFVVFSVGTSSIKLPSSMSVTFSSFTVSSCPLFSVIGVSLLSSFLSLEEKELIIILVNLI